MSTTSFPMKTISRKDISNDFSTNNCIVHGHRPTLMQIVAGTRSKYTYFVASCDEDACSKLSMESGEDIAKIWNNWNQAKKINYIKNLL